MTDPLPYANPFPADPAADRANLNALAICHYVWGGMCILFGCIPIIYVIMGILMISKPGVFNNGQSPPPPTFLGDMFIAMGSCGILFGWGVGILNIYTGRCIHRSRKRVFSLVIAGINCISVPLGTILGIFTFVVLLRPSVKYLYDTPT